MSENNTNTVFVYGTLQRGHGNHRLLDVEGAALVGRAQTVKKFDLITDGLPYVFPESGSFHVKGEVYEVTDEVLASLDRLEGHPRLYKREIIWVQNDLGAPRAAWIYFYQGRRNFSVPATDRYSRTWGNGRHAFHKD